MDPDIIRWEEDGGNVPPEQEQDDEVPVDVPE